MITTARSDKSPCSRTVGLSRRACTVAPKNENCRRLLIARTRKEICQTPLAPWHKSQVPVHDSGRLKASYPPESQILRQNLVWQCLFRLTLLTRPRQICQRTNLVAKHHVTLLTHCRVIPPADEPKSYSASNFLQPVSRRPAGKDQPGNATPDSRLLILWCERESTRQRQ